MLYEPERRAPLTARIRNFYACETSVRSAFSVTALASAGSPFGSGMFQFMSNWVRSTTVSSFRPRRVAPKWSTVGPVAVPVSVAGYQQLRRFASRWPQASWAIEGAGGLGAPLAIRLCGEGIAVMDVPAKLAARVRLLSRGHGPQKR